MKYLDRTGRMGVPVVAGMIDRILERLFANIRMVPQSPLQLFDDLRRPAHGIIASTDVHGVIAGADANVKSRPDQP